MRRVLGVALCCLLLVSAMTAQGQESRGQRVVATITAPELAGVMGVLGYREVEIDEDDDVLVGDMQGYRVLFLVGSMDDGVILAKLALTDHGMTLEDVNTWNREYMYSRMYLDEDEDVILEAELDMVGGVTIDRVVDFVKTFDQSIAVFGERF